MQDGRSEQVFLQGVQSIYALLLYAFSEFVDMAELFPDCL